MNKPTKPTKMKVKIHNLVKLWYISVRPELVHHVDLGSCMEYPTTYRTNSPWHKKVVHKNEVWSENNPGPFSDDSIYCLDGDQYEATKFLLNRMLERHRKDVEQTQAKLEAVRALYYKYCAGMEGATEGEASDSLIEKS